MDDGAASGGLQEVADGVVAVPVAFEGGGLVHCYLVDGDQRVLVDTGTATTAAAALLPALTRLGWPPQSIRMIILTHGHPDHAGGITSLRTSTDATVALHPGDAVLGSPAEQVARFADAPFAAIDGHGTATHATARAAVSRMVGVGFTVDRELEDGSRVDLGGGRYLRVLHLPGHTDGSCGLVLPDGGVIAGDAVGGRGSRDPSLPLYVDAPSYRRSLLRLRALAPPALLLGHAYRWPGPPGVVRRGPEVIDSVDDALAVWQLLHDTVGELLASAPQQRMATLVRGVVTRTAAALGNDLSRIDWRQARVPFGAVQTVMAHRTPAAG